MLKAVTNSLLLKMQIKLHDVNKDKNAVKEKNIGKADIEWWLHFLELWKRFFFLSTPSFHSFSLNTLQLYNSLWKTRVTVWMSVCGTRLSSLHGATCSVKFITLAGIETIQQGSSTVTHVIKDQLKLNQKKWIGSQKRGCRAGSFLWKTKGW